jgi:hypothetical protein
MSCRVGGCQSAMTTRDIIRGVTVPRIAYGEMLQCEVCKGLRGQMVETSVVDGSTFVQRKECANCGGQGYIWKPRFAGLEEETA